MGVKLTFALCETLLVHISDRLYKEKSYKCPHCKEDVIPRKGSKREHHFSHKPHSICSVSNETLLHFEAKYYLAKRINERKDIRLLLGLDFFTKKYRTFFNAINLEKYEVSLLDIIQYYGKPVACVEKQVGNSIVDISVTDDSNNSEPFVLEIYVTHCNDNKKISYFHYAEIPYLELIPVRKENEFTFDVHDGHLRRYIKHISNNMIDTVTNMSYMLFKDEMLEIARKDFKKKVLLELKKQLIEELKEEVRNVRYRYYIDGKKYKKMNSIEAKVYKRIIVKRERLHDISYRNSSKSGNKFLMANDKYFVSNEQNMLYALLTELKKHYDIEVLIGGWEDSKKESAVGVNVLLPNSMIIVEEMNSILDDMVENLSESWIEDT